MNTVTFRIFFTIFKRPANLVKIGERKKLDGYKGLCFPVSSFVSQLKLGKNAKNHLKIEAQDTPGPLFSV